MKREFIEKGYTTHSLWSLHIFTNSNFTMILWNTWFCYSHLRDEESEVNVTQSHNDSRSKCKDQVWFWKSFFTTILELLSQDHSVKEDWTPSALWQALSSGSLQEIFGETFPPPGENQHRVDWKPAHSEAAIKRHCIQDSNPGNQLVS